MADTPDPINILVPRSWRDSLSRRAVLQLGAGGVGAAFLAACGSSKKTASPTGGTSGGGACRTAGPTTTSASATTAAATETTAGSPGSLPPLGKAPSGYSDVINKSSGTLNMYTWGEYNDPEIVGDLAQKDLGITMKVDYYTSNEDLITKLSTAGKSSGYDVVVPTGPYIPQMIQKGLLEKFDKTKLPNIVNIDPFYLKQAWDPGNDYSVCKDWGSTGWMWDTTQVKGTIATWNDFINACTCEASGNCSVLDTAANIFGMWAWANGKDWNTTDTADLDAGEKFLVDTFASHIKAFDSYPSTKIAEGAYGLAMAWNGDARAAYQKISDAGGDPGTWKWALGAPNTELWMDNYCIAAGSPNPDAAHAWINWLLTPEVSIKDLQYHGYNSGMKNMPDLIKALAPKLLHPDIIFFSDDQVKSMRTQKITSAQDRLQDIYNKIKAKAGG